MKLGALAIVAGFAALAGAAALSQQEINALSPIDSVPTKPQIDLVFNGAPQARDRLITIAQDPTTDVGVRLRALHALWKYCPLAPVATTDPCLSTDPGWPAHEVLVALVPPVPAAWPRSGPDLLVLRASIESLGLLKVPADVNLLTPLLDHPSRDIRAATAHALRDLCNPQATNPLRVRYSQENVDQVRLAISDALRVLASCGP